MTASRHSRPLLPAVAGEAVEGCDNPTAGLAGDGARPETGSGGAESDLPSAGGGAGRAAPGRAYRRGLRPEVPAARADLAPAVGAADPVLCRSARGPAGPLHHQRHRAPLQLRQALTTRGHFPNDVAALKLPYLVRNITPRWTRPGPTGRPPRPSLPSSPPTGSPCRGSSLAYTQRTG